MYRCTCTVRVSQYLKCDVPCKQHTLLDRCLWMLGQQVTLLTVFRTQANRIYSWGFEEPVSGESPGSTSPSKLIPAYTMYYPE